MATKKNNDELDLDALEDSQGFVPKRAVKKPAGLGLNKEKIDKNLSGEAAAEANAKAEQEKARADVAEAKNKELAQQLEILRKGTIDKPEDHDYQGVPLENLVVNENQEYFFENIEDILKLKESDKNAKLTVAKQSALTKFEELKDNIRKSRLAQPIVVRTREDGKYEIIAGHSRVAAYKELLKETGDPKYKEIRALIYTREEMSDETAKDLFVSTNYFSRGTLPSKSQARCQLYLARRLKELTKRGEGRIVEKQAEKGGKSLNYYQNWKSMARLEDEYFDLYDNKILDQKGCLKISKLPEADQKRLLNECKDFLTTAIVRKVAIPEENYDIEAIIKQLQNSGEPLEPAKALPQEATITIKLKETDKEALKQLIDDYAKSNNLKLEITVS